MKIARDLVIGFLLGLAVAIAPLYCHDEASRKEVAAAKQAVAQAKLERAVVIETLTVHAPAVATALRENDRISQLVRLDGLTAVTVRVTPTNEPQRIELPPLVIEKMRSDSTAIAVLKQKVADLEAVVRADSTVIHRQDTLTTKMEGGEKRAFRRGVRIGAGVTVGAIILVKLVTLVL